MCLCVCATCLWLQSDRKMRADRQTERMRVGDTCVCLCVGVDAQCWQLPSCRLCDNTLLNTEYYMHAVYMPWHEYVCVCVCMHVSVHFHIHKFVINLHKYFGCTRHEAYLAIE